MPDQPIQHQSTNWRKSSRSGGSGACVEIATEGRPVLVRDSRNPSGVVLAFPPDQWSAFLRRTVNGEARTAG
jgi:Domain of unknown function (DUF397)